MGLLLSILVGCVGVIELLACFKHLTNDVKISSAPCLFYHNSSIDTPSYHDSLCNITHSEEIRIPHSTRSKLENLHEYSLRMRSELRSRGYGDGSTISDFSNFDISGMTRTDSRLSLDFESFVCDAEQRWNNIDASEVDKEVATIITQRHKLQQNSIRSDLQLEEVIDFGSVPKTLISNEDSYVRPPTPIPLTISQELSKSNSSIDLTTSFDADSGKELPTRDFFENVPIVITRCHDSSSSPRSSLEELFEVSKRLRKRGFTKKVESELTRQLYNCDSPQIVDLNDVLLTESNKNIIQDQGVSPSRQFTKKRSKTLSSVRSSSILRKPTRLKSKNAEISKSAENLAEKKTKRQRDPERRKSDISIQTTNRNSYRDEWTNTSPTDSERSSISHSRSSVSVQVQTNFDADDNKFLFNVPLSESKRDVNNLRNSRKSYINKRFPKSQSLDNNYNNEDNRCVNSMMFHGNSETVRNSRVEGSAASSDCLKCLTRHSTEEDSIDEEFLDAEDDSSSPSGPIQYSIPNVESSEAFWLIFSGEYTKAMNKDWHSGHFCCWQCDESLTGQRYVLRDEHPYCIKCYESVFANGCEECNKIIGIDSKDLSYKDKHWHEACFLCNKCRVSLVDKQFGSKVDKIYCGNCYDAQFASRCDGCGEIFRAGTKKMEYKTRQWHEKCFCCVVCKNPIGTKSFIPREQEIYCAGCYEDKFATRCVKCNKIITSGGVTYKNEPWHRDCFTCSHCNNSLAGQRFTSRDDKPYCAECFGELFAKRCTACAKPITGIGGTRFISFEDRHWHNDCFICAGCNTSLVGRGFITDGDDIICPECAKQKLSE